MKKSLLLRLLCLAFAVFCSLNVCAAEGDHPIGIIGASEEEVALLIDAMELEKVTPVSQMLYYEGRLAGKEVVVVQCGIGKVNAGICAQTLIREFEVSRVINTGVARTLSDEIEIGDIVVSTDAVQYDFDMSILEGFQKGEIPYTGRFSFPADEDLQKTAMEAVRETVPDSSVFSGRICSGDHFVYSVEQKNEILDSFGGLCCEQEAGAIAQVCWLNQVPYVILRAISDKPDGSEEQEYNVFMKDAAGKSAEAVAKMISLMAEEPAEELTEELTEEPAAKPAEESAEEPEHTMIVTINANMRDAPHGEFVRVIPSGTSVKVLGTAGENNDWYQIEIFGVPGYVYKDLLREE